MVKCAAIDDLNEIVNLVMKYRDFYGVHNQSREEVESFIRDRITNDQSKIFIAIDVNGHGIGFIQLYPSYSTVSLKPQWALNDLHVEAEKDGRHKEIDKVRRCYAERQNGSTDRPRDQRYDLLSCCGS